MKIYCTSTAHQLRPSSQKSQWVGPHFDNMAQLIQCLQEADIVLSWASWQPGDLRQLPVLGVACALSKPIVLFVEEQIEASLHLAECYRTARQPDAQCECGLVRGLDEMLVSDSYWLAAQLPNVVLVEPVDTETAQLISRNIDQTESPIECALYLALLQSDLESGCCAQYEIGKYRLDFAYPQVKLAIECDGHDYHKTKEQRGHDAERDRYLLTQGWRTARFTGSQIFKDANACAAEVATLLGLSRKLSHEVFPLETPREPTAAFRDEPVRYSSSRPTEDIWVKNYSDEVKAVMVELERCNYGRLITALEEADEVRIDFCEDTMEVVFAHNQPSLFSETVKRYSNLLCAVGQKLFNRTIEVSVLCPEYAQ